MQNARDKSKPTVPYCLSCVQDLPVHACHARLRPDGDHGLLYSHLHQRQVQYLPALLKVIFGPLFSWGFVGVIPHWTRTRFYGGPLHFHYRNGAAKSSPGFWAEIGTRILPCVTGLRANDLAMSHPTLSHATPCVFCRVKTHKVVSQVSISCLWL